MGANFRAGRRKSLARPRPRGGGRDVQGSALGGYRISRLPHCTDTPYSSAQFSVSTITIREKLFFPISDYMSSLTHAAKLAYDLTRLCYST